MSSPPPRFAAAFDPDFDTDRRSLGLSGRNFDYFFRAIEFYVCDDPWLLYSEEVPDSEGIRIVPTREAFPDIPPLYVYYRVERNPHKVVFLGLSPAWSQSETV